MSSRVTTVVITRNRREQLLETLPRHVPPVIVVDNGSEDGTADAVERAHPEATVVRLGRNLAAGGRTVGARLARTEHVAFADDDSWWEPGSLDRAVEVLDRHRRIGLLVARVVLEPAGTDDPFNAVLAASPLPGDPAAPGVPVLGFMACAAVVRRDAFLAAGGFDPVLGIGGEEQLLAWDLAALGWELRHLDDLVVHHEPRSGPGRSRPGRRAGLHRAAVLTAVMRRSPATIATAVGQAVRDGPPGIRGVAGAMPHLGYALSHRRRLPSSVEQDVRILER